MYQKPNIIAISKEKILEFAEAGACVFFYTGCTRNYDSCVYGYSK